MTGIQYKINRRSPALSEIKPSDRVIKDWTAIHTYIQGSFKVNSFLGEKTFLCRRQLHSLGPVESTLC